MAVERYQSAIGGAHPELPTANWRAHLAEAIAATLPSAGLGGAWLREVLPSADELRAIEEAASLIAHPSTPPARRWEAMLDIRKRTDGVLRLCLVARALLIAAGPTDPA